MKTFRTGDKVWDCRHGNGVVESIIDNDDFPIEVFFEGDKDQYTKEGKYWDNEDGRALYHGHDLSVNEKEPNRKIKRWINLAYSPSSGAVYHIGHLFYETEQKALSMDIEGLHNYIKTIEVEIDELK